MNNAKRIHLKNNIIRQIKSGIEVVEQHTRKNKNYENLTTKIKAQLTRRLNAVRMQLETQTQKKYTVEYQFKKLSNKKLGVNIRIVNNSISLLTNLTPFDDYKVDKDGNISLLRKTDDVFDVLHNSSKSESLKVGKGILSKKYTQTGVDSDGNKFSYDVLKVRGDENARKIFEFMSNHTNVEWSHIFLGKSGNKGLNYLTTSHDKAKERGMAHMINTQFQFGYTIRGHAHNHPSNTPYPSGLSGDGKGDIGAAKAITNWYTNKYPGRSAPFFKIYTAKDGKYINYNKDSIISDFIIIELPEIIITPKQ